MPLLGAHMSIAGGLHFAVEAAARYGMETVQIFTANARQWPKLATQSAKLRKKAHSPGIGAERAQLFRQSLAEHKIEHPLAHASYLINLAAADEVLWRKSIPAMAEELSRATCLGVPYVVVHPGAHTTLSREAGLARVVAAIDEIHELSPEDGAQILLENTAGQGSCLGCRFQDLATILEGVHNAGRLAVCIDTCHAFAAGYDLTTDKGYEATWRECERLLGLAKIRAFHLNDSKKELGSRVDRHAHIGDGQLGLSAFRRLLNDKRFAELPMYLETPKGDHEGRPWDEVNLARLRELLNSA